MTSCWPDDVLGHQHDQPLHEVAQLAHVALPGQLDEEVDGAGRQPLGLDVVLDAGQAEEVLGQLGDVLAPRAAAAARAMVSTLIRW